ncbi:MAG: NAD(P)H-dependent oxidoreductase [Muribaculaceae bacterium]|nr:NAD(P)H-dependent oxidoreductase [Muribaculaceae bacterium]MDE7110104.1 NAD(P)H-dependent oxidoreductase [Muribaculaceae bacterium]
MKIIAINGSPRKDGNSAKLLQNWVEGFRYLHPEAEMEWLDLYSFYTKREQMLADIILGLINKWVKA